jgi:DNA-binding MarR family transcriptional regulator
MGARETWSRVVARLVARRFVERTPGERYRDVNTYRATDEGLRVASSRDRSGDGHPGDHLGDHPDGHTRDENGGRRRNDLSGPKKSSTTTKDSDVTVTGDRSPDDAARWSVEFVRAVTELVRLLLSGASLAPVSPDVLRAAEHIMTKTTIRTSRSGCRRGIIRNLRAEPETVKETLKEIEAEKVAERQRDPYNVVTSRGMSNVLTCKCGRTRAEGCSKCDPTLASHVA